MKFIHAADLHLCASYRHSSLPSDIADRQREQLWTSFFKLIQTCQDENIDLLLISGDLIEAKFAKTSDFKRIADAFASIPNTRVFLSCGNHDPLTDDSYYHLIPFPENVHIFPTEMSCVKIEDLNTCVYGFSWKQNRYQAQPFALPKPEKGMINLLCLHCDVLNPSEYLPMDTSVFEGLPFNYIALGHIHQPMQVHKQIFYAGSPEPLDFGEEGRHGFFVGNMADKKLKISFRKFAHREFATIAVELSGDMDYNDIKDAVYDACGEQDDNSIIRIVFKGLTGPHIDLAMLVEEIRGDFYSLSIMDETNIDYDIEKIKRDNRDNLVGQFIASLEEKAMEDPIARKALVYGLQALLEQNGGRS